MSADHLDVLELREFNKHCLECDTVVVELNKRDQRVEQSRARSWIDSCYVQHERELRVITRCAKRFCYRSLNSFNISAPFTLASNTTLSSVKSLWKTHEASRWSFRCVARRSSWRHGARSGTARCHVAARYTTREREQILGAFVLADHRTRVLMPATLRARALS